MASELQVSRFGAVSEERVVAASCLRRLGHDFVGRDVPDELCREIASTVEGWLERLDRAPRRRRSFEYLSDSASAVWDGEVLGDGEALAHFPDCVVSGQANPMGVAIDVRREGDDVVARVVLGAAFEGAPGQAHGGVVAAVFDDVMGYQLSLLRVPAFTGRLVVSYRAPTPMEVALEFRARVARATDRKLEMLATATTVEGVLVAEAEATFVVVPVERMRSGLAQGAD